MTTPTAAATADERLATLQREFGTPLLQYLVKLTLGDRRLAEDILQETYLRAWRHLCQHEDVNLGAFRPWLYTVSRRLMIDMLRARKVRPREIIFEDLTRVADENDSIRDLLAADVIRTALLELRPDQRSLLVDLYYHGRSPAEVAQSLNIPVGTVKSRSHLAKRALWARLEAGGYHDA